MVVGENPLPIDDPSQTPSAVTNSANAVLVRGLRTVFTVSKTSLKEPNKCDIKIYNLSETTRGQLKTKSAPVVLSAGYSDSSGVIFTGDARTIDSARDGADWVTHIQCGDGERSFRFARFGKSYGPGATVLQVIQDTVEALGLNPGNTVSLDPSTFPNAFQTFPQGFTAHGRASDTLDQLMRAIGLSWSIQNGSVIVRPPNGVLPGSAIYLSPTTGLIGSPDHSAPTQKVFSSMVKARSLLQWQHRVGGAVQLAAKGISGVFSSYKVEFRGDTNGNDWYTDLELIPLSGYAPA